MTIKRLGPSIFAVPWFNGDSLGAPDFKVIALETSMVDAFIAAAHRIDKLAWDFCHAYMEVFSGFKPINKRRKGRKLSPEDIKKLTQAWEALDKNWHSYFFGYYGNDGYSIFCNHVQLVLMGMHNFRLNKKGHELVPLHLLTGQYSLFTYVTTLNNNMMQLDTHFRELVFEPGSKDLPNGFLYVSRSDYEKLEKTVSRFTADLSSFAVSIVLELRAMKRQPYIDNVRMPTLYALKIEHIR